MEDLNCKSVQALLWDEGKDVAFGMGESSVDAHLSGCRECSRDRAEIRSMQTGLRSLPKKAISPLLATRLQVIAFARAFASGSPAERESPLCRY